MMLLDTNGEIVRLRLLLESTVVVNMLTNERYKYTAGIEWQCDRYLVPQDVFLGSNIIYLRYGQFLGQ